MVMVISLNSVFQTQWCRKVRGGPTLCPRRPVAGSAVELLPPELLASSSDSDSRLSVLWPLIIRIFGDFSSWKLFSLGWPLLLLGDVTNLPPADRSVLGTVVCLCNPVFAGF